MNKKKVFLIVSVTAVILILFSGLVWRGCAPQKAVPDRRGKLKVVASGYVPYALVKQIGGERVSASMLLPPHAEPHGFEPTPGAAVAVNEADVFVYVSARLEPWARDLSSGVKKSTVVVEAAKPFAQEQDPHVWMSFSHMRQMARTVADALEGQDPSHSAYYAANLDAFNKELDALDAEYRRGLASCQNRDVVHVGHLAFGRLADAYGLKLNALGGSSHDGEQSVRNLVRLVRFIKRNNIKTIFTEESVSPQLAQTVARETGVTLLPLYTVEHVSKDEFDQNVTYAQFMRMNLDNLRRGLVCNP